MKLSDNMVIQTLNDLLSTLVKESLLKNRFVFYVRFSKVWIKKNWLTFKRRASLLKIGSWITFLYLLFVIISFGWRFGDLFNPDKMGLNEVGDFLAGVFGPIAFGWLVIGYLMQNRELKNSVEQTKEAQRLASNQLEFQIKCKEREELSIHNNAQPILDVKNVILEDEIDDYGCANFRFEIKNNGSTIYDLCIYDCEINKENEDLYAPVNSPVVKLMENGIDQVSFSYHPTIEELNSEPLIRIKLSLTFLDSNKNRQQTYIKLTVLQLTKDGEIGGYIGRTFKEFAYK
tara:strand:+ start:2095 stop:2958 length:864 start_codon:yes stop_codon:yes gene_type:complete